MLLFLRANSLHFAFVVSSLHCANALHATEVLHIISTHRLPKGQILNYETDIGVVDENTTKVHNEHNKVRAKHRSNEGNVRKEKLNEITT